MIKRIVKLTFNPKNIEEFKLLFVQKKSKIEAFEGCFEVELLQNKNIPHQFFTISIWESEDALNTYRKSDFFKDTWKKTKSMFIEKPEAWSLEIAKKQ